MTNQIDGDWVGGIEIEKWVFIKAHFDPERAEGTMDIPEKSMIAVNLTHIRTEDAHLHFELEDAEHTIFHGQLENNTLSGEITTAGTQGTFHLTKIMLCEPATVEKYFGTYRLESGRILVFGWRWNAFVYLEGRRIIQVYPLSETVGFSEKGETITFDNRTLLVALNGSEISGTKIDVYCEEEVTFSSTVTLSGVLTAPGEEFNPAVVLIHGSGAESREGYRFLADHLARHGIAALRYDKRGVGDSEGDWHYAALEDLAEDVLAGVHFLQHHKNINAKAVGVVGTSQGGWVAPLAASQSEDVAFMVVISGAAVSPQSQELYRVTNELRYKGYSDSGVTLRVTGYRLELAAAKILRVIQNTVSVSKVLPPRLAFGLYLNWDFDPVPILKKIACPVLAIFGELDKLVPVKESVTLLKEALKDNDTITVFPKGNHALLESEIWVWSEIPRLKKKEFVPGYYDLISDWIKEQVKNTKEGKK
ncbi:MAG: alpha/beta fold hydrolase [Theionarchaea archaeon]|nr:MAG: hypothetical protein AYK18_15700 [Theionarchaea archaeon DG-70]MBU7009932.1 alpha/beta fold hydrolase [Theionarchaea archaeon]